MGTRIAELIFVSMTLLCIAVYAQEPLLQQANVPHYPAIAIAARLDGTVHLHVTVKDGVVVKVEPDAATRMKIRFLTEGAIYDIETWKFRPTDNAEIAVTFTYELSKEEAHAYGNPHIEMELPSWVKITAKPIARE